MKKKILYSILNEWRDEDMNDSPIDLDDDMNIEPTSSDMSDEPDLDDDEFALSTTQKTSYKYFPETREELKEIIRMEIEKQGGVNVDLNMIDTSKITDMNNMFNKYTSLQNLDVSVWDVSNVKYMNGMFFGCTSLKSLDVRGWDVSNVEYMNGMFSDCESLETLDISGWDVSNVTNMKYMFYGCKSLHTDIRKWKIRTNNIDNMYYNAPHIKHN